MAQAWSNGVLAVVPYYLQRLRGEARTQVSPSWLREEDAIAAAADLENIRVVSGWWASPPIFPRRIGFSVKRPRERMAEWHWQDAVEREMARYYELCGRDVPDRHLHGQQWQSGQ